jgi:putative transposase
MEQLTLFVPSQDTGDIMLSPTSVWKNKQTPSVIVVSQVPNREMISKDKSSRAKKNIPKPKSSKTSEVASAISVKGLNPYWDKQCEEINSKLWLPIKTCSHVLDLNSENGLSNKALGKSWFSSKLIFPLRPSLPTTYSASSMFFHVECTHDEITKTKSVKLYPNKKQRQIFKKWQDCSRYVFNQTIDYIRSCVNFSPSWMDIKKDLLKQLPKWCDKVPFQIKGIAVKEAHQAYWKAKGHPRFRSRKAPTQSCYIPKSAIKDAGIYPKISGKGLRYSETLPEIPLDSRLVHQYGEWFLSVPHKNATHVAENQGRVVALDPGVRTFQTFYSEHLAGQIGYDDFGRIQRLCHHLDKLISRTSKATGKAKREMKRAAARIRKKIKNLIKEIHFKTARFLVDSFDVILLPTFETSQMTGKSSRKLTNKTVRAMLTYAHYQFKVRLKNKALEFGKKVIDVCEAYTSKTVSWTGEIKNVGGSRVISSGGITLDRDLNGARGIFIRSLVDSPSLTGAIVSVC